MLVIFKALWRHKIIAFFIVVLTIAGVVYLLAYTPPVYEARASFAFFNPPGPPSQSAIDRDPSLAAINPDNPYTRFGDQSVVVEILARRMSSAPFRRLLRAAGADQRYQVVPSRRFGSSPIAEITGVGSTPEKALLTTDLVSDALVRELRALQERESVHERYLIRAAKVESSDRARLRVSSQLRSVVAFVGLQTFLLVVLVSVADAISSSRAGRKAKKTSRSPEPSAWTI